MSANADQNPAPSTLGGVLEFYDGINSYGHPTTETLSKLIGQDVEIFRTDMQGDIVCVSDGKKKDMYLVETALKSIDRKGYQLCTRCSIVEKRGICYSWFAKKVYMEGR